MVVGVGRASVFVGFWGVYCCEVLSDVVGEGGCCWLFARIVWN